MLTKRSEQPEQTSQSISSTSMITVTLLNDDENGITSSEEQREKDETLKLLLDKLESTTNKDEFPQLKEQIHTFLNNKYDINTQNSTGNTLLHIYCSKVYDRKYSDVLSSDDISDLLKKFRPGNIKNNNKCTPVQIVMNNEEIQIRAERKIELMLELIEHGFPVNTQDKKKNNVFHYIFTYIISDEKKTTLFDRAMECARKQNIRFISKNDAGLSPLNLATQLTNTYYTKQILNFQRQKEVELPKLQTNILLLEENKSNTSTAETQVEDVTELLKSTLSK